MNSVPSVLLWFLLRLGGHSAEACTTLAVGAKASADGSVLLSHSNDFEGNGDARLCFVPAADHAPGSSRPIYWDKEDYPRFVGHGRGSCYEPAAGQKPYEPIGYIPQVNHTYAYYEAQYGIMNEHGLGIGETTCSGVFATTAVGRGGKALLSIDSLTRIAMERARTAREAVELIGGLAEAHGFYGVGSFEGGAESLMVGDPKEVFVFHILPDPSGTSAIWAAQRVPDDHVAVAANMFIIRNIDFADTTNFLFSSSVRSVAEAKGWWQLGQPLDFTAIYSDGEYAQKFYSGRRVWGAYRKFGVVGLPDNYTDLRHDAVYPVTAKPPSPVKVRDLFSIHRDYYEGTKFDMTKGLAAGPWGDPDRFMTTSNVTGNWERSIGIYRTTTAHVVQVRSVGQGSVLWFGPHASASTCFVPVSAPSSAVPAPYSIADPNALSRQSAYWAHRTVFNVAKIKYSYAMEDVRALQARLETEGEALVARLDAMLPQADTETLNEAYAEHAARVHQAFWALPDQIVQKYADGWLHDQAPLGYPDWWLRAVGYQQGPPPPPKQPNPAAQPSLASGMKLGSTKCSDGVVQRCVQSCPVDGFALCAADCTQPCVTQPPALVV
mmetsp:Transcript_106390/g.266574  ORF Transcript_106390/g.266574 Transcript_106390/m.266574 type:complete len:606 (-) Transcript_106390:92-1909(-)|eukprot:CAMPEP_0115226438 /NCGR_PEP_ID=MMETSP0270-20121206/30630_1 /TAXON_ID=71861 /ORGANISM="Scrippsiella trochoidea, Strain CCMP3099" /LENGTH=605 /DNA_ID=CAMNT_0002640859 /DNA_START=71 /DNA_END=1888 /DNA_ORIENTATION=+